ncbi:MAG TPA: MFS transporter, partial [Terrimesophilobacter sp.]|nr:MFS transporter [Terrimesophilobacter sp.]
MIDRRRLQRRVLRGLITGQILGGIGFGAVVSVGAILAAEVSGSDAWSGMASTMSTLGAALFAIPMARAAEARGRRISLTLGASSALAGVLVATLAAGVGSFPL